MPASAPSRPLARNLAALGERNGDLAAALAEATPRPLEFTPSRKGPLTAEGEDGRLASRHDPAEEGRRLAEGVDLVENAVVVVLGFGLGYHVQALAERLGRRGVIVVFEPDLGLLRSVLETIDHSAWLGEALVLFVSDADDRGGLATKLQGAESLLGQGTAILDHPPSARRLGAARERFTSLFADYMTTTKTTLMTTLVRSLQTVRNLMHNVDHYVNCPGVADLHDAAKGALGVVVSAGPSLRRNLALLAEPGVRDRCVIIAVQTALKPLLEAGVRPHFVTALDYHEISGRFYEGLTPGDVEGVTLVVEPKAHPVILDAFPGPVRCSAAPFLDQVLGPHALENGDLSGGATVAHLALYLARYLGCDPICLIGQDLGFPDGLYYTPGTAIHDVWAPELNEFNTVEMMEWQRIVRHRVHLHRLSDQNGKPIYTDAQMLTYLQQFERDFARLASEGVSIIDATEGGVRKQHAVARPLAEVLDAHARPRPSLPEPAPFDSTRGEAVMERLQALQREVAAACAASRKTEGLVTRMLEHQRDHAKMTRLFKELDRVRAGANNYPDAFALINRINQLGAFKRLRADRRIDMLDPKDPYEAQRLQLERDLDNMRWTADAGSELIDLLNDAQRVLQGEAVDHRIPMPPDPRVTPAESRRSDRVAAMVPVDPDRGGLGSRRDLHDSIDGRALLTRTLERLGMIDDIASIILLAPEGWDPGTLIDDAAIELPVHIEPGAPDGFSAFVASARAFSPTSWRGGVGGATVFDELLRPAALARAMATHDLDAVFLCGPDWPLFDVSDESGAGALIRRHLENRENDRLTFTQAPPGLSGCVIGRTLADELAAHPGAMLGQSLAYRPSMPQPDPIATGANIQIDHRVRHAMVRAIDDSPRRRRGWSDALRCPDDPVGIVNALDAGRDARHDGPQHVTLELTPRRTSTGFLVQTGGPETDMSTDDARAIVAALGPAGDVTLTLGGRGDPLLHPSFDEIIGAAKEAGVLAVHVRTEMLAEPAVIDRLLASPVDVVTIDLHADTAETYTQVMGVDRFLDAIANLEHAMRGRRKLTDAQGRPCGALPWLSPRLRRCADTYGDLESFFDRWQHILGTAVIEPTAPGAAGGLLETEAPAAFTEAQARSNLMIRSDGAVMFEDDLTSDAVAGRLPDTALRSAWARVLEARLSSPSPVTEAVLS